MKMAKKRLIALLLCVVIISPILILIIGKIQLSRIEKQAKSLNIPLNVKSIEQLYGPNKNSKEVTSKFLKALKHISKFPLEVLTYYWDSDKKMGYNKTLAKEFITKNYQSLEELSKINNFTEIRFPIDYANPNCVKISSNTSLTVNARLIVIAKLRLAISNRDVKSTVSSLNLLFRLGDSVLHNPFYIGFLNYNGATSHWYYCFQETIKRVKLPQSALLDIIKKLDDREKNLKTNYIKLLNGATFVLFYLVDNNNPTNIEGKNLKSIDSFSLKNIKKDKSYIPWFMVAGVFEKKAILSDVIYIREKLLDFENFKKNESAWIKFDKQSKSHTLAPFYNKISTYYKSYLQTLNSIITVRRAKIVAAILLYKMKYKKLPKQINDLSPEFVNAQTIRNPKTGSFFNLKDILSSTKLSGETIGVKP